MVNIAKITKKRLGEILVAEGLVTNEQVQEALQEQQKTGLLLGETLVKLGYVTEIDIAGALSAEFGLPYFEATNYAVTKDVFNLLPLDFMNKNQLVPLDKIDNIITIAVAGPLSAKVFEELERITSCESYLFVTTASQVHKVIQQQSETASAEKK